jgi:integrase/recombinase XerD
VPVEELDPAAPLFVDEAGRRLSQQQVARIVRRVCRGAGIRSWAKITPHSLRHAFITLALDGGSPLHVVSDHVGHASTRTTQRYDRDRGALSRSPVHNLAAFTEPERE